MELDSRFARPLEAMHPEMAAAYHQPDLVIGLGSQHQERAVGQNELATSRMRAASGIQRYGSAQMAAPYSLMARSKQASGRPVSSALPWISGKWRSCSSWRPRAVFSCRLLALAVCR
jgi:hypothetical protein